MATKKKTTKKAAAKKAPARKTAKKTTAKKPAAKKAPAKKTAARKSAPKKPAAKKAPAKKGAKRAAGAKSSAKKTAAKKPAARKAAPKKAAPKKSLARKAVEKIAETAVSLVESVTHMGEEEHAGAPSEAPSGGESSGGDAEPPAVEAGPPPVAEAPPAPPAPAPETFPGPQLGDEAPDFTLPADDGTTVSLHDLRGKKVILYFHPRDNTPGCTLEGRDFSQLLPEFEAKNAVVLGVSTDDVDSHQHFKRTCELSVKLLADTDKAAHNAYSTWREKNMYGKTVWGTARTTYLIDENGRIARVWPKVKVEDHALDVLNAL